MARTRLPAELRRAVRRRARERCEYCLIAESLSFAPHEVDHVIAIKHRGRTEAKNLALSCAVCNGFKGSDIASIDPATGKLTPLFHPRRQRWSRHFRLVNARIEPRTACGRATERLLQFNNPQRVAERRLHIAADLLAAPSG